MRRRKPQPWYQDVRHRLWFAQPARRQFPNLKESATGRGREAEVVYRVELRVPEYDITRKAEIRLPNGFEPHTPTVTVDGPTDSPHRYDDDALCMWRPKDPPQMKWQPNDGLLVLLRYIQLHLFREEWWRETGEWLGEEAPHGSSQKEKAA
jgi:hypothetical protein